MQELYPHIPQIVKSVSYTPDDLSRALSSIPYYLSVDAQFDEKKAQADHYINFWSNSFDRPRGEQASEATSRRAERLGNSAKSEAASGETIDFVEVSKNGNRSIQVDYSSGEVLEVEAKGRKRQVVADLDKARSERFELQSVAGRLLPKSRTSKCLKFEHNRQSNGAASGAGVQVLRSETHGTCHYEGLQTCASVWACPVCAAKISERRMQEVKQAIDAHVSAGGGVLMVTYTFPHSRNDDLPDLLGCLSLAIRKMKARRDYKAMRDFAAQVGTIRALEVTHGGNGWHPHIHELWLVDRVPADLDCFTSKLFDSWARACELSDLPRPSVEHGVNVRVCNDSDVAAAYVAKEMTKSHSKRGRSGNYTAFDLLRAVADGDMSKAPLFVEYANAFKGSRQLVWSRGLKERFLITEMSDEEIFAIKDEESIVIGTIDRPTWRMICRHERRFPKSSPRAVILSIAQSSGWGAVEVFISRLWVSDSSVSSARFRSVAKQVE